MADNGIDEVPKGERGELWVKAPQLMKGYWKKPEATRETITPDGWLMTGDIAFEDADGKLSIVDRKKVRMLSHLYFVADIGAGVDQSQGQSGCTRGIGGFASGAPGNSRRRSGRIESVSHPQSTNRSHLIRTKLRGREATCLRREKTGQ